MAVLNLRKVPEDLMRQLRKAAIDAGEPFHEHCVRLLERAARSPRAERFGQSTDLPTAAAPQASDLVFAPAGPRPRRSPAASSVEVDIT